MQRPMATSQKPDRKGGQASTKVSRESTRMNADFEKLIPVDPGQVAANRFRNLPSLTVGLLTLLSQRSIALAIRISQSL